MRFKSMVTPVFVHPPKFILIDWNVYRKFSVIRDWRISILAGANIS
jgi:hypothetical protein